jgi:hypothetical protein
MNNKDLRKLLEEYPDDMEIGTLVPEFNLPPHIIRYNAIYKPRVTLETIDDRNTLYIQFHRD